MVPSMSRPANPYDNASCESFMKTLKREEIYANKYDDLENLRANIQEFIEQYYNRQRLHSALGYRSPEEFEQQIEASGSTESRSATMVFFENKQNDERGSTRLLGKETQMPSPSPDPFSCQKMQKRCYESGSCVQKKLCHSKGSPQRIGNNLGTFAAENWPKSCIRTQDKARRANNIAFFCSCCTSTCRTPACR